MHINVTLLKKAIPVALLFALGLVSASGSAQVTIPECGPSIQPGELCVWPKHAGGRDAGGAVSLPTQTLWDGIAGQPGTTERRAVVLVETMKADGDRFYRGAFTTIEYRLGIQNCGPGEFVWHGEAWLLELCGSEK